MKDIFYYNMPRISREEWKKITEIILKLFGQKESAQ